MKLKLSFIIVSLVLLTIKLTLGQTTSGELRGKITDNQTGDAIPGTLIIASGNGNNNGVAADENGEYKIKPLATGTYSLTFSFIGYNKIEITNVRISDGELVRLNAALEMNNELPIVEKKEYRNPLMPLNPNTPQIISGEDVEHAVSKSVNYLTATGAKTFQSDVGKPISLAGSRYSSTKFIIDGMPVDGEPNIPGCSIDQISIYIGSIPANYGDATGGVVIITSKRFKF